MSNILFLKTGQNGFLWLLESIFLMNFCNSKPGYTQHWDFCLFMQTHAHRNVIQIISILISFMGIIFCFLFYPIQVCCSYISKGCIPMWCIYIMTILQKACVWGQQHGELSAFHHIWKHKHQGNMDIKSPTNYHQHHVGWEEQNRDVRCAGKCKDKSQGWLRSPPPISINNLESK